MELWKKTHRDQESKLAAFRPDLFRKLIRIARTRNARTCEARLARTIDNLEYTNDKSCNVIGQYQVTISHSDLLSFNSDFL